MAKLEFKLVPVMPYTLFNGDVKYSIGYLSSVKGMLRTASIFGFRTLFGEVILVRSCSVRLVRN